MERIRELARRTPIVHCWFWDVLVMCALATWWGCETWGLMR